MLLISYLFLIFLVNWPSTIIQILLYIHSSFALFLLPCISIALSESRALLFLNDHPPSLLFHINSQNQISILREPYPKNIFLKFFQISKIFICNSEIFLSHLLFVSSLDLLDSILCFILFLPLSTYLKC